MLTIDKSTARRLWPQVSRLQVAQLVIILVGLAVEMGFAFTEAAMAPLASFRYYAEAVMFALLFAALVLLAVVPLAGFIVTALAGAANAFLPDASDPSLLWLLPVAVAGIGIYLIARSGTTAGAPSRPLPVHGNYPDSLAYRSPRLALASLAVLPVAAVALGVWHQIALADTMAFESRAEQVSATVMTPVDGDGEFTVRFGEREYVLGSWSFDEDPSVGDEVSVLVDPEDPEHVVHVDGTDDPSWILMLAVLALLLMPYPYTRWVRPARDRRRLVDEGGPVHRARLLDLPSGATYLLPVDGTWPAVRLTDLEPLLPVEDIEEHLEWFDDDEDLSDEDQDAEIEEEPEPLPWSADELERFLREDAWLEADPEIDELYFGPDAQWPVPVDVIGDPRRGSSVAIVQGEGLWLTKLHTSNWRPGLRNQLRNATRSTLPTGMLSRLQNFHPQLLRGLWAVGAAASMPLLVLVAVGAEEWLRPLLLAGSLVASGLTLGLGEGAVSLRPGRLTLHGTHSDEVVVPSQVVSVAAVDDLVALRVNNPDDVVVITADALAGRFGATGQEALERIALWRGIGDTGARPGPRLSLLLWLTVATAGVGLAAVGVALW